MLLDGLRQESFGRSTIAPFTEEDINRLPVFVYPPIPIDPFAVELDLPLIDAPRCAHRPSVALPPLREFWDLPLHPAHHRRMRHLNTTLRHHLSEIAITQLVGHIPPDTESDDLSVTMAPLE